MTRCRNATLAELETILGWAAKEGWNPGLEDAKAFYAADPKGFFVAIDDADQPIASISVVNHTTDFAFLGLYIVAPDYRGQGTGLALWNHALKHAGDRTIGLDGVEAQQENYCTSGFVYAGGTTRFTGCVDGRQHPRIQAANQSQIATLIRLEAEASGVEKPNFLRPWFSKTATRTTFVLTDQGSVQGFCTTRTCRAGAKIGPLIAENTDAAQRLIAHAAEGITGPISLDIPAVATELAELCQLLRLEPGFKTARMYRGTFAAPSHRCFSVSSLELG